jgi:hypothetical protein
MNGVYTELAEVNYELFYSKQTQSNPMSNYSCVFELVVYNLVICDA